MATSIAERKKLVINEEYLTRLSSAPDYRPVLYKDLSSLLDEGEVHLMPPDNPRLAALYSDVRTYVCAMAIKMGYSIVPADNYDANKIRAALGGKVTGSPSKGYRFKRQQ